MVAEWLLALPGSGSTRFGCNAFSSIPAYLFLPGRVDRVQCGAVRRFQASNTSQLVAGLLSIKVTYRFKVARACVVFLGVPGLSSAWNGAEPSPALLWLFGLPIWVIVPSFITLNMLIFVGVFAAFRCWILPRTTAGRLMRRYRTWITPGFKQLKCQAWHCALAGGLVGSLLAMTLADTWRVLGEMVLY